MHGGKAARGIASSRYKDGRFSRALPARLREAYESAADDPHLLELREQIALLDARLVDLLTRVDTGESGALWRDLQQARYSYLDAVRAGNFESQKAALSLVLDLIRRGHNDYRAWADVRASIEQRKRLVESERKHLAQIEQMLTQQQAIALLTAMVDAVRQHVTDRAVLAQVQATYDRLVGPVVDQALDLSRN